MEFLVPFLLALTAGLSTLIGAVIFFVYRKVSDTALHFFLGLSAGVMIYLSFLELLPESIEKIGAISGHIYFFVGMIFMALVDRFFLHHIVQRSICKQKDCDHRLFGTGIMIAVGLGLHNIPEGIAVFMGSYVDLSFGFLLAGAIALHNIPEGIAIAAPIIRATGSRWEGMKYAGIAGIAEPVGAIISYVLLRPYLQSDLVYYLFALVAGVMVYISFDELLPVCLKCDVKHIPLIGIVIGMVISFVSILLLHG